MATHTFKSLTERTVVALSVGEKGDVQVKVSRDGKEWHLDEVPPEYPHGITLTKTGRTVEVSEEGAMGQQMITETIYLDGPEDDSPPEEPAEKIEAPKRTAPPRVRRK